MRLFDRIKWVFKKPEYYSNEHFNLEEHSPRFEFLSDEILIELTSVLKGKFNSSNIDDVIGEFKLKIQDEIQESENYRKENNFSITYFLSEDLLQKDDGVFVYQCISDNNDQIGSTISPLYVFQFMKGKILMREIN